jgi:hypothetical protein
MASTRIKWAVGLAVGVILLGGGGVLAYSAFGTSAPPPSPVVNELKNDLKELVESGRSGSPMEERLELVKKMAEKAKDIEKLGPEDRKQVFKNFQGVVFDHVDKYFEMPEDARQTQLDADIDFMVFMTKMGSLFMPNRGNRGQGQNGDASGGGADGQAKTDNQRGPRDWRNASPQERDRMRREWLDTTTPEQRARMSEYRRQFESRAKERGVALPQGPRRM